MSDDCCDNSDPGIDVVEVTEHDLICVEGETEFQVIETNEDGRLSLELTERAVLPPDTVEVSSSEEILITDSSSESVTVLEVNKIGPSSPSGESTFLIDFSRELRVPSAGLLYMDYDDLPTSAIPYYPSHHIRITRADVLVDQADGLSDYEAILSVDGVDRVTIPLPSGDTRGTVSASAEDVLATQGLSARLVRTSGPTSKSEFSMSRILLRAFLVNG